MTKTSPAAQGTVRKTGAEMIAYHRFALHEDGNTAEVDSGGLAEEIDKALSASPSPEALPASGVEATYGIIDPDYARVFTIARCVAWQEGYALVMHGSFTRDLDLLAVPWTERATDPEHLVRRIVSNLDDLDLLVKHTKAPSQATQKPHGRLAWTLTFKAFGDPRFVDLSVMPRAALTSAPAPEDRT